MSVSTVGTYTVFQSTLSDVSKVQNDLTNEQQQLSSGNAYQDFGKMANQTQQYLSLNATISRTSQYLNNNKVIEARVNTTDSALSQVITTGTGLQTLILQYRSGTAGNAAYDAQLQGIWQQLAGQLNARLDGQFLFSGSKTNVAPVDPGVFPSNASPGVPDATYYNGSTQDLVARADDNTSITYNVRADADGFQQLIAGLALAQQAGRTHSDADFSQALDLVQQGLQSITAIQATVNATVVQFSTIDDNLTNQKLYLKGIQESIGNTDIVSVSTQVAVNQGILQASFMAFSKITSLRLSDYLK